MYYPYLRAKQFELLAVREFANEEGEKRIFPILEPVKKTFNSLNRALDILVQKELSFGLILNPHVGDLVGEIDFIYESITEIVKESNFFHPTFIVQNNTIIRNIITHIDEKAFNNVILVLCSVKDIDNPDFINLCNHPSVNTFIIESENRTLKRRLREKEIILLKENFISQKRNADYLDNDDEFFTEEHTFYKDEGYSGFSDYTTIGKDYLDGGRLPYAVAIHLTYKKNVEQIWVRHFVSDTNDDNSNIQGKFGEAVEKAIEFIDEKNMHYEACEELRNYYNDGAYPGLGMIKKISIKNHFELMNDLLIS